LKSLVFFGATPSVAIGQAESGPAEIASSLRRRKAIYERMHPETKNGAIGNGREKSPQNEDSSPPERFTAATAKAVGKSEQSIQRAASRGENIDAETLNAVVGTSLDKGVELDALAKMTPEERKPLVEAAKAGEKEQGGRLRS
jgi:ParB family transcriptional regulator, chromosome partitioning protein